MCRKGKAMKYRYRSAITGRFVSKDFAEANPDTTIRETVKDEVCEDE